MRAELMKRSKLFWTLVIITGLYFIARESAQLAIHAGWLDLGLPEEGAIWFGRDLRIVVDAALRMAQRGDTYYLGVWPDGFDVYNYSPLYALTVAQIATRFPFTSHALAHGLLGLVAYVALFFTWLRLFPRLGVPKAGAFQLAILPLWLIYAGWWGDSILLNIYIPLALIVSWVFYFVWQERLIPAALLLVLVLQSKPQWAFALALPLVLGRFRFFAKLFTAVVLGYLGAAALTIGILGLDYGVAQYQAYYTMLDIAPTQISWHGPGEYIGYDHSVAQIYFYLFGYSPDAWTVVRLIKLALLAPLGLVAILVMRLKPERQPQLALEAFFSLYYASFIWLDLVWETTLSIIAFIFLMTVLQKRWQRWIVAVPFIWYAISDLWQVVGVPVSALVLGTDVVSVQGPPLWADPSFRIPIIMLVILGSYSVLLGRIFQGLNHGSPLPATIMES